MKVCWLFLLPYIQWHCLDLPAKTWTDLTAGIARRRWQRRVGDPSDPAQCPTIPSTALLLLVGLCKSNKEQSLALDLLVSRLPLCLYSAEGSLI